VRGRWGQGGLLLWVPMTRRSNWSRNITSWRVFEGEEEGLMWSRKICGGEVPGLPPVMEIIYL
jgi:hypothetical protein